MSTPVLGLRSTIDTLAILEYLQDFFRTWPVDEVPMTPETVLEFISAVMRDFTLFDAAGIKAFLHEPAVQNSTEPPLIEALPVTNLLQ